ncbi:MAG: 3-oxoacyl-ACP reductase FabG [Clostridia bacterium]|nr:3-oxoacyl-ACP reductase FabG [Clostridia bacterium]
MFDLSGKIALVTGSSRGIGKAIATRLAEAGAEVILHGRSDSSALKATAEDIIAKGGKAHTVFADTSSIEQIDAMFDKIKKDFGHLDIMVNNAAIVLRAPFLEISVEDWDRTMTTNSRGYFYCGQSAAKLMLDNENGGRIINISSISQFEAASGRCHYCASKGAIGMLTKGMALELAEKNITVNAVLPGSIHTDFNDDVLSDPEFYAKCVAGIPAGRLGKADDIAGAVVMLASEEASYISGAEIVIDGAKTVF